MSLPELPAALVEEILEQFEPVLPEGVFLEMRGGRLSVHGPSGQFRTNRIGQVGVLPWLPMPQSRKTQLVVQDLAEEVAQAIGHATMTDWPGPGATTAVTVTEDRIQIAFKTRDPPRTLLALEPINWDGPFSEPSRDRSARGTGERRYFGAVPPDHAETVAQSDQVAAERSAALRDLHATVRAKSKGMTTQQVRLLLRSEYQSRGLEPPSPDGAREDFTVGLITASDHTHSTVASLPVLAKGLVDLVKWGRNAIKEDRDDEEAADD